MNGCLIDWLVFYAVLAVSLPYDGGNEGEIEIRCTYLKQDVVSLKATT